MGDRAVAVEGFEIQVPFRHLCLAVLVLGSLDDSLADVVDVELLPVELSVAA